MLFDIITIFPEMFTALDYGITGRAQKKKLIEIKCWDLRDYSDNKHRQVDDRPYGGGPGMVLMYAPLQKAIQKAKAFHPQPAKVIHLSPQGKCLKQQDIKNIVQDASYRHLIFVAGRYEGIDERLLAKEIDEEWSIGDYVLTGGELASMVLIDSLTRLLPDALGAPLSASQDSFSDNLLDYPHYTRPEVIADKKIPEILKSGDHQKIATWRLKQALGRTWLRRPDLLAKHKLTKLEEKLLHEFQAKQQKR